MANKIWDNLKYQEWYLTAKYHPQIMLWFVTTTRKRTLFKLSGTMLWKPYDFLKTSSKSSNNFLGSRPFAVYTRLFALNTEVKPITCPFVQVMYGQIYYHCGKYDVFNVIFCHLESFRTCALSSWRSVYLHKLYLGQCHTRCLSQSQLLANVKFLEHTVEAWIILRLKLTYHHFFTLLIISNSKA